MSAMNPSCEMAPQPMPTATLTVTPLTAGETSSAVTGKSREDVAFPTNPPNMNALGVGTPNMKLRSAVEHRCTQAPTAYNPEAWFRHLEAANLTSRYSNVYGGLHFGFHAGIPPLTRTFSPLDPFVNQEFTKGSQMISHPHIAHFP